MMKTYAEAKKELDEIRNEYGCKGEIIFRTALQYVVEHGQRRFKRKTWVKNQLHTIDVKHDIAESEGKTLWISREFEKAFIEGAAEIAEVDTYSLLIYIQKEVWLSHEGGIDYDRAVELLKRCMNQIESDEMYENAETYNVFDGIGFTDEELEEFGFKYLIKEEEE